MDERVNFIMDYQPARWTVTELCSEYGISRTLAYKYICRFNSFDIQELLDFPKSPHIIANKTPPDIEQSIISLRKKHPRYGPEKLLPKLKEEYPSTH